MYTVRSTDPAYTSPLIGNGAVVTTLGPTGYHNLLPRLSSPRKWLHPSRMRVAWYQ